MIFKIHYGLWYGGLVGIIPFMLPYAMRYSDTTPIEHGILFTILPFIALVAKPLAGSIADRFGAHRQVMVASILAALLGYGSLAIYPFFPTLTTQHKTIMSLLYYLAALVGNTAMCITNSISDSLAINSSARKGLSYGHYRLWGPIGFGVLGTIWGLVNQLTYLPDFTFGIIFMMIILALNMFIVAIWKDELEFTVVTTTSDNPETSRVRYGTSGAAGTSAAASIEEAPTTLGEDGDRLQLSFSRTARLVIAMCRKHKSVFGYIIIFTFCGIMTAIHWQFFFQYAKEVTKTETQFKIIATWALPLQAIGGELIFFMLSGKIINRFGTSTSMIICLLSFSLRYLLYAFVIPNVNVYWILLVELLQGPCFGLMYSVLTHQANYYSEKVDAILEANTTPGNEKLKNSLHTTLQGLLGSSFEGLGLGIGALIGGLSFAKTPLFMWQLAGFSSLIMALICTVVSLMQTMCPCFELGFPNTEAPEATQAQAQATVPVPAPIPEPVPGPAHAPHEHYSIGGPELPPGPLNKPDNVAS